MLAGLFFGGVQDITTCPSPHSCCPTYRPKKHANQPQKIPTSTKTRRQKSKRRGQAVFYFGGLVLIYQLAIYNFTTTIAIRPVLVLFSCVALR